MINIAFPEYSYKIKILNNKEVIFDEFRKKWIVLTPEEWVRQNVIMYLTLTKLYPKSLIAIEKEIQLGDMKRRFDIVVYKNEKPLILIECKQMNVKLSNSTISQVLAYNSIINANYFAITNGNETKLWNILNEEPYLMNAFPNWDEI